LARAKLIGTCEIKVDFTQRMHIADKNGVNFVQGRRQHKMSRGQNEKIVTYGCIFRSL